MEMRAQPVDQLGRGVEVDAESAARPERELDQALEHPEVVDGARLTLGDEIGGEVRDSATGLLEREADPHRATGVPRPLLKRAPGQRGGTKPRVDQRRDRGRRHSKMRSRLMRPHT